MLHLGMETYKQATNVIKNFFYTHEHIFQIIGTTERFLMGKGALSIITDSSISIWRFLQQLPLTGSSAVAAALTRHCRIFIASASCPLLPKIVLQQTPFAQDEEAFLICY